MRPVLFQWRGRRIHSYPALLYLGLLFGIAAENLAANVADMDSLAVFVATLLLLVPALVGARVAYVLPRWRAYRRDPRRIWGRSEGGAAMFGGLPLALALSVPLLGALGLSFWAFWDVATFTLLVASTFTRIGCLLNGCCGGRPTTSRWAPRLPDTDGVRTRRVPTQLLDAGWTSLLLVGAVVLWPQRPFPGALFLYALSGYGAGRFLLEFTRAKRHAVVASLTVHQLVSLALSVAAPTVGLYLA